jgi:hypothetical protein
MKAGVFLEELATRVACLRSRTDHTLTETPFEAKRQFFSVFNSFETSSRKERCLFRRLPDPHPYSLRDYARPGLLPAMILAFEDQSALERAFAVVAYYLEVALPNETEKARCKATFKHIMALFFRMSQFGVQSLTEHFDEEKLFGGILGNEHFEANIDEWVHTEV